MQRVASSSSIIHRLSLRVDPVCLDMEKAQQASERGLSVVRREGKVKRINNAIIVQCQNEILFNEASLKICQKSRAHQSGPVPCREVCVVGWCGHGGKPKAVSRYALISISRIIRHRLRLHLARGHNHYHHHNHHHHRSSLSLSLSSVYMGHHRWNRCIKYFVCSDGKLHWNTNLQIQIDVALCQRSGHSDQSSPVPDTAPERPLGWARHWAL